MAGWAPYREPDLVGCTAARGAPTVHQRQFNYIQVEYHVTRALGVPPKLCYPCHGYRSEEGGLLLAGKATIGRDYYGLTYNEQQEFQYIVDFPLDWRLEA